MSLCFFSIVLTNKTLDTLKGNSETVAGDGSGTDACSVSTLISLLNCASGTSALTLAAGTAGQIKILSMIDATAAATLSTANGNMLAAQVANQITFNAVGETATLMYNGSNWIVTSVQGASIA